MKTVATQYIIPRTGKTYTCTKKYMRKEVRKALEEAKLNDWLIIIVKVKK